MAEDVEGRNQADNAKPSFVSQLSIIASYFLLIRSLILKQASYCKTITSFK